MSLGLGELVAPASSLPVRNAISVTEIAIPSVAAKPIAAMLVIVVTVVVVTVVIMLSNKVYVSVDDFVSLCQ